MIISRQQRGVVKDFIGLVQNHLLPFEKQEKRATGKRMWCNDWWTIEVLKCLYWTADAYRLDTFPKRLIGNPAFPGIEEMVKCAENKLKMMDSLTYVQDLADILYVCEAGRGIDMLLAFMVKEWKKVIAYDMNADYVRLLPVHFPGKPIEAFVANSGDIDFIHSITEPVILIADNHRLGKKGMDDINANPNVKAAIFEGVLLHGAA